MKKILFTLEIAMFLLALPLVLGMALGRKLPVNKEPRQDAIPAAKKDRQQDNYSVVFPGADNNAI